MVPPPYGGGNVTIDDNDVEHVQDGYQIYGIGIIDKQRSVFMNYSISLPYMCVILIHCRVNLYNWYL